MNDSSFEEQARIIETSEMAQELARVFKHAWLHTRVACPVHPSERDPSPNVAFACRHCTPGSQDKDRPVGIVLSKSHYFICTECLDLWSRGKFKIGKEICAECRHCIKIEVERLMQIKPTLFTDLMNDPNADFNKIQIGG